MQRCRWGRQWRLAALYCQPDLRSVPALPTVPTRAPLGWIYPNILPASRTNSQGLAWLDGPWKLVSDSHSCNLTAPLLSVAIGGSMAAAGVEPTANLRVPAAGANHACRPALHNLDDDPAEVHDLSMAEPARFAQMQRRLDLWLDDVYSSRTACNEN